MGTLIQDFRYALRMLARAPGFTAAAVLMLALGIGGTTAIFSVLEAVMLRALPYRDPQKLMLVSDAENRENGGFLYKDIVAFRAQSHSFASLAAYYRDSGFSRATLNTAGNATGEPEQVQGAWTEAEMFPLLGVSPRLGRVFTRDEEARQQHVIVLSAGLWKRRFGQSPAALGQSLLVNGTPFLIIGVMPEEFQFPARDQVFWAPLTANPYWGDPALTRAPQPGMPEHNRLFYERWQMIGRLREGATPAEAQAESETILQRLAQNDPDKFRAAGLRIIPLRVEVSEVTRLALLSLFAAVCCVLLIACSNLANLMLARGAAREREIAIRAALGARRIRLLQQLLTEGLVLALAAGICGLALAWAGVRALVAVAPADIPRLEQAGINPAVLGFALLLSVAATLLFALGPALRNTRRGAQENLNSRGASASRGVRRAQGLLVVAEFAMALVLLTGAGLLLRSLLAVESVEPGFEPRHVLTLHMAASQGSDARLALMHQDLLRRLQALPGVQYAGAIDDLFESAKPDLLGLRAIEGRNVEPPEKWSALIWKKLSGDYFQAMGATLLKGRYFNQQDNAGSPLVAIIDESMARRYWPGQDPMGAAIGAKIKGQDPRGHDDEWLTVIGVVGDMHRAGLEHGTTPHIYEWSPQAGEDRALDWVVRASGDPRAMESSFHNAVRSEDANAVLSSVSTVEDLLSEQLRPRRFRTWLLGMFSALSLLLASIGIYAVMHYAVVQRRHEMGVRLALGARPRDILRLVERDGMRLALAGVGLGLAGSAALIPLLSSLLFGVRVSDPMTFLVVITALLAVAGVSCYLPARRAASVDPMDALRVE